VTQGWTDVEWPPGHKRGLAPPCSNLRSFGSKCSALKKKGGTLLGFFGTPGNPAPEALSRPAPVIMPLVWHFAIKGAAVKFPEPWMLNHFSELADNSYIGSLMCPECPTKEFRGKFCWLSTRESGPEIAQVLVGVTTSPTLLGPVLLWSQENYLKLLFTVWYSKSSWGCFPATSLEGKRAWKWMKWITFFFSLLIDISSVSSAQLVSEQVP